MKTYLIASLPMQSMSAQEVASVAARAIRTHDRTLKSQQVVQLPVVDGGTGTIEQVVTHTLGSFLEVEATSGTGEEIVVPMGFAGENNNMAIIEMHAVARAANTKAHAESSSSASSTKKRRAGSALVTGTTYGIGELIQDAIDEGAFSIVLGWDEPIARDAGFGMAEALGVKFFDKQDAQVHFKECDPDALTRVQKIDASGRPFQLLSSRFFVAKSLGVVRSETEQVSMDAKLYEKELERLAAIIERDCGVKVNTSEVHTHGSGVDFGLKAFLNAEIRDGSMLMLEAQHIPELFASEEIVMFWFAERAEDLTSSESGEGVKALAKLSKEKSMAMSIVLASKPSSEQKQKLTRRFGAGVNVVSLADAKVFAAPVRENASDEEIRRDRTMRIEKLIPTLFADTESSLIVQ